MDQSLLIVHAQVPLYACDLHTSMLNRVGGIDDDVQPIYKCDEAPAGARSWLPLLTFFCLEIQIDRKIPKFYHLANAKCQDRAVLWMFHRKHLFRYTLTISQWNLHSRLMLARDVSSVLRSSDALYRSVYQFISVSVSLFSNTFTLVKQWVNF